MGEAHCPCEVGVGVGMGILFTPMPGLAQLHTVLCVHLVFPVDRLHTSKQKICVMLTLFSDISV